MGAIVVPMRLGLCRNDAGTHALWLLGQVAMHRPLQRQCRVPATQEAVRMPELTPDFSGEWRFDPDHTRIGFSTRHAMVTKVRGAFQRR